MIENIKEFTKKFLEKTQNKQIQIISHHDTDGITSAAIASKALQRLKKNFSLKIVKGLDEEVFEEISKTSENKIILFLDLASNSFSYIKNLKTDVFILDHHEINSQVPDNVTIVNPHINNNPEISGAGVTYFFARELDEQNTDLAYLAVIGMVGDTLEKDLNKFYNDIIKDSKVVIKKGLILYPATRPINKILEYSSEIYIPGVTGSNKGTCAFLRDIGITPINGQYKTLIELNQEELSRLITAIAVQKADSKDYSELIGNIYLINFFNRLEDARQISAMINACSRLGESGTAVSLCLQNKIAKQKADNIYTEYKQNIVKALENLPKLKKIEKNNYIIIHAEDKIKDTIIGTIASILSNSNSHQNGKAIIAMAYNNNKIKVSARVVGRNGNNIREILDSVINEVGGEVGGHKYAAGCLLEREKEEKFLEVLQKRLEIEVVKF
ncbi:MAG TPA: DHH family phosphoesterase [Candidatus Paceibacterota bacterium]|nr:DHH family phosphoesterase [Candidatus Paceibacterota bacterium]